MNEILSDHNQRLVDTMIMIIDDGISHRETLQVRAIGCAIVALKSALQYTEGFRKAEIQVRIGLLDRQLAALDGEDHKQTPPSIDKPLQQYPLTPRESFENNTPA